MKCKGGFISLGLVALGLFLLVIGQLFVATLKKERQAEEEYLRQQQLELLCTTAAEHMDEPIEHAGLLLQPGNLAVNLTHYKEEAGNFTYYRTQVTAPGKGLTQVRKRLVWRPPEELISLSPYALATPLLSPHHLQQPTLYTSTGKLNLFDLELAARHGRGLPTREDLEAQGFGHHLYYLPSGTYTIRAQGTHPGKAALVGPGRLVLEAGCKIKGPLLVINKGGISLGSGCSLEAAVLLSEGPITLGANSSLKGLCYSSQSITLQEGVLVEPEADLVAPFASVLFVN